MRLKTVRRAVNKSVVCILLSSMFLVGQAGADGTDSPILWSDDREGTTTKTGSEFGTKCGSGSANAVEEADTLALMDTWAATSSGVGFTYLSPAVTPADDVSGDSAVLTFPGVSDVNVTVSRRQVLPADATDPTSGSTGALSNNSKFSDSARLQDCAPRPADLTTSPAGMILDSGATFSGLGAAPATFWNATTFPSGNQLDGALFEFSKPVGSFGLWFGDLETRFPDPDGGGVLAVVKLLDSSGNVIKSTEILPDENPTDDLVCGGPVQSTDNLGCGNQATRFIGFVEPAENVSKMLVIVGDDDSCEQASQCDGITEYLSWIGPMLAVEQPDLTVEKTVNTPLPTTVGDSISWTITVSNLGGRDAATGWTVTDVPGVGVSGVTISGDAAEVDCTAGTSCIGLTPLAANSSVTLTVTGTHQAAYGVPVHNASFVSPVEGDIPEIIVEGENPAPDTDTAETETNNDTAVSYVIEEPPPETTTTTETTMPSTTSTTIPENTDTTTGNTTETTQQGTSLSTITTQPEGTGQEDTTTSVAVQPETLAFTGSGGTRWFVGLGALLLCIGGCGAWMLARNTDPSASESLKS